MFDWWHDMWYAIQRTLLVICDTIQKVFNQLIGLDDVTINGNSENAVLYFLRKSEVWNVFMWIVVIGVSLLVVFMIISIIRSEMKEETVANKKKIYKNGGKAIVSFLIVPVVLFVGIFLVNGVMQSVNNAMVGTDEKVTIGGEITVIAGQEAYKDESTNREEIEESIRTGKNGYEYSNMDTMRKYYDFSKNDKVLGVVSAIALMVVLAISVLRLIQRIIEIVLLFIISPIVVSTTPLDDGARFATWREMVVSKVIGAYGIVITMNIFFMVIPALTRINFGTQTAIGAGIIKILIILGGALAVNVGNLIIAQLISPNAGNNEAQLQASNFRTGLMMGRTAGGLAIGGMGRILGGQNWATNRRFGGGILTSFGRGIHGGGGGGSGGAAPSGLFRSSGTHSHPAPMTGGRVIKGFTVDSAKNFANGGIFGVLGGAGRGIKNVHAAHNHEGLMHAQEVVKSWKKNINNKYKDK